MKRKCWSCRRNIVDRDDHCFGCGHLVCVPCAIRYQHTLSGAHARPKRRKRRVVAAVILLLFAAPLHAQEPVNRWADWASYGTAAINPTIAAVDAWRSPSRGCHFARLALEEGIGNGLSLTLKHFIVSPRPCLGCQPDGMPSGHTLNATIGFSTSWKWGTAAALTTAQLRTDAHRHTPWQVLAGAGLGVLAEGLGHAIIRCEE